MSTPTTVNLVPSTTPTLANETPESAENTGGGMPVVDPIPDGTDDPQDSQTN